MTDDIFLTTPTDPPSGVSVGHKNPQELLCNFLVEQAFHFYQLYYSPKMAQAEM